MTSVRIESVFRASLVFLATTVVASSCSNSRPKPATTTVKQRAVKVQFDDVTKQVGISFVHNNGAFGKKWLPETMGGGVCWIDYDGDGWQDLFFVNSQDWWFPQAKGKKRPNVTPTNKLYRNRGNATFEDVTEKAGLAQKIYGMGCCVGDFDNDGMPDLYVTGLGRNYLYRNQTGKFTEQAKQLGVADSGWSSSCAWVDYDKDGWLDLFVCHYVVWRSPSDHIPFSITGNSETEPSYSTPQNYTGEHCRLFHNEGGRGFKDVSGQAGITKGKEGRKLQGKSLGVTICDLDRDGWLDIAVANDTEPNYLFRNRGNGTFEEIGLESGMGVSAQGAARGAMGIHAADIGNDGREDLIIGNFTNEMLSLYENRGNRLFIDVAARSEVGGASRLFLAFGCFFFDFDNDGWQDIFVATGHVEDDIAKTDPRVTYAERPLLFRNLGQQAEGPKFREVGLTSGEPLKVPRVGRGAAAADFDLNGTLDVVLAQNGRPAVLLKNTTVGRNNAVRITLIGTEANQSAIGTLVKLKAGDMEQERRVQSGGSYCSQCELPVMFGMGRSREGKLTVSWPSKQNNEEKFSVKANQWLTIQQGKGIISEKTLTS